MSGRGKRFWPAQISFEQAYEITLEFLQNCKKHQISVEIQEPKLFHTYHLDGTYPINGMIDTSQILKFGYSSEPEKDQLKRDFAPLISVAIKAHFFLLQGAQVVHEPFIFGIPDLYHVGKMRYGLIYSVENLGKRSTIIVSEWDLSRDSSQLAKLNNKQKFPVVLTKNSFDWLTLSKWRILKKESEDFPWYGQGKEYFDFLNKIKTHLDVNTFEYGHILEYPIELNQEIKDVGAVYAPGIRKWVIPKGINPIPIIQYLDNLNQKDPQEIYLLRWLQNKPYPNKKP